MKQPELSSAPRSARELRLKPLVLSLVCLGLTPALAQVLPVAPATGIQIDGTVAIQPGAPAGTMNILQSTPRAIAAWQSFSIGATNTVNVAQPSAASVLLNRVVGNELSTIAGKLSANGHIYLVNPNGVLFSPGSSVSVGGLIASTLDVSNASFMAGGKQLVFERTDVNGNTVVNQGSITASAGGTVALMGAQAINQGSINVARGSAALVSARTVTVDFDGDGLTRFTIPSDSKATAALVENSGSITADGGRIALLAASTAKAQVVNQTGVLRARSLEARNGEIVLAAGLEADAANVNSMRVGGTLDASGGESGSGGQITTTAHRIVVDADAQVGAGGSGQPFTSDGKWTIRSGQDITVSNNPPFQPNSVDTAPVDGGSIINAGALGRALSRSTNVVLESAAQQTEFDNVNGYSAGFGVTFDLGAQVLKNEGRGVTLTVNSARHIGMEFESSIQASNGALNVDFNADSRGAPLPDQMPIVVNTSVANSGGSIQLQTASIETNGGNIRFYGQSDPGNGRAVGGFALSRDGIREDGIRLDDALLSTCAAGQAACTGGGGISLRGQGITANFEGSQADSGAGVILLGGTLRSGAGAIALDGRGSLGASGVRLRPSIEIETVASIESTSGDVRITGSTRGWSSTDPVIIFRSNDEFNTNANIGGGAGVSLVGASITTGGNVGIDGTGADLTALGNDAGFRSQLLGFTGGNSATVGGSNGVLINDTDITAGAGRQIVVSGKAGSGGFTSTFNATEGTDVAFNTAPAYGVEVDASLEVGAMRAEGGRIAIEGRDNSDVRLFSDDATEGGTRTLLNVSSATLAGGSIDIRGRNIGIFNTLPGATFNFFDARGAGSGGTISVRAIADPAVADSGAIAIDPNSGMTADAISATGNGGSIRVVADGGLRTHGSYSARGGAQGGNGGLVETSGGNVNVTGIRVDASAPAGQAGTWLVDPFNISIDHGLAAGSLPTNPFEAIADSAILDGDINFALNGGTSVTIGTGVPDPSSFDGTISFGRLVDINLTGPAPVTFKLDAARDIRSDFGDTLIRSTGTAPLSVEFNAGLSGATGSIVYNGQAIQTNGGSVTMNAIGGTFDGCAICLRNTFVDSRTGGSDAGVGGNVTLTVPAPGPGSTGSTTSAAVDITNTTILASTGNVGITGFSQFGSGVRILGTIFSAEGSGSIQTTSGNITVAGVGAFSSNSADATGNGVSIDGALLRTVDGNIAVRGRRQAGATPGTGVSLRNGTQLVAAGAGDIEVTGEALGGGTGVLLTAATTNGQGQTFAASKIDGNRHVVLRASNDGASDAIVIDGTVRAGQVLNLRPGGVVAASGAGVDRTADAISLLGGPGAAGYAISADELGRMTAATVVAGSNTHAGNIDVLAPMSSAVPLTLHNGGGGNITLHAPISAPTLGLISGGNITQAAGAAITAGTLLAQSDRGNVLLGEPTNNVSANTLGGSAISGRFEFVNSGPLRVGPVSVTGFDAAGNLPQVVATDSMAADTVFVRTLAGELTLAASIGTFSGTDLVAATTFQNAGGSIGGGPWRIWADTWVGETRGGLVGSGQFPNLYHCAFLGLCTVTVSPGDNHFIYAQQPTATVTIGGFSRAVGQANPNFTFTLGGLILGDTGVGINGNPSSEAGTQSPAGRYPIFGTFTSAEGYAINVVPGELLVTDALTPLAALAPARFVDVLREEPTTWLYDRNIGQAPICIATGPLEGDRAQQGNDLLAREWSRVRTRPNLTSCLDTERSNGCADF
ncbi:MAG TPA: filamentous hemagglutinin N-terminal domain-containing protein [Variovorax sp.]|nr:filamentous hemagglutinin N-terminal domain-containing protein [Variovorax sp.]